MNDKLKERVSRCEEKIRDSRRKFKLIEDEINMSLKSFGEARKRTIDEIIPEFIEINEIIGQRVNKGEYLIPSAIKLAEISVPVCNLPKLEVFDKLKQISPLINAGGQGINFFLQQYLKSKGKTPVYQPYNNEGGLALLLKGVAALANYISAKAAQNEAEETAVREYEKKVNIQIGMMDNYLSILNNELLPRIEELTYATRELHERSLIALQDLRNNISVQFDFNKEQHRKSYEVAKVLVIWVSKLAKLRIMDDNNKLSEYDTQFLIEYKKI